MRTLLREPLFHFLVIGAALFGLSFAFDKSEAPSDNRIVVSQGTINTLAATFRLRRLRAPTKAELDGMIRDHVKEEIYYREALRLGLDRNDTIIRRRLRQKVEFLLQDRLSTLTPRDGELEAFFERNKARYRLGDRISFDQVVLRRSRHGEKIAEVAGDVLSKLNADQGPRDFARFSELGLLPTTISKETENEISRTFGQGFARSIADLPEGKWSGPVSSGYGLHLVRLTGREKGGLPPLNKIRDRVERDWLEERRISGADAFYRALRAQYTIEVDMPGDRAQPGKPAK